MKGSSLFLYKQSKSKNIYKSSKPKKLRSNRGQKTVRQSFTAIENELKDLMCH